MILGIQLAAVIRWRSSFSVADICSPAIGESSRQNPEVPEANVRGKPREEIPGTPSRLL